MDYKIELVTLLLCVVPVFVTTITITSNGNSPEIKMLGGMMVDVQNGFVPMESKIQETIIRTSRDKKRKIVNNNTTKLSINERYRRLIPYMTFYYANDLATPNQNVKEVEVEKAEIVEAGNIEQREPKKIIYSNRNIPRYQGNRLTQHNIASANPTKVYYKGGVPIHPIPIKVSQNHNPLFSDYNVLLHNDFDNGRIIQKQPLSSPGHSLLSPTRKPYLNLYHEETPNIRYYLSEKEETPKYKLVPYEQTPPVKVPENHNLFDTAVKHQKPIPVSVLISKEQVSSILKPRPVRPHYVYENVNIPQGAIRKQPAIVSESYYEKQRPPVLLARPVIQSGFKPILNSPQYDTETSIYSTNTPETVVSDIESQKQQEVHIQPSPVTIGDFKPNYYEYVVEEPRPTYKPPRVTPSRPPPLSSLLNSLQLNKSVPKPITKENVGSSIRTLLQVLNILKAVPQQNNVEPPILSTPKPFVAPKLQVAQVTIKPEVLTETERPEVANSEELHDEPYLAPVNPPSQHLDDIPSEYGTSQRFPQLQNSDDEGGTPGRPGIDYPILTTIPPTSFDCKTQRYKGFFADPETRCQVWHYCDLNGGQASFLCPNGTIFSQAGLTCDWWFNVRCASTTQLYVLNESLYKYILPHSPKFPEDYSGPLVDKYLTLKFKEMEEEFQKKKKNKQAASEKVDSDEEQSDDSGESSTEKDGSSEEQDTKSDGESAVSEASVIVDSPGESGKVERLHDE